MLVILINDENTYSMNYNRSAFSHISKQLKKWGRISGDVPNDAQGSVQGKKLVFEREACDAFTIRLDVTQITYMTYSGIWSTVGPVVRVEVRAC